jgi:hypothetical protein
MHSEELYSQRKGIYSPYIQILFSVGLCVLMVLVNGVMNWHYTTVFNIAWWTYVLSLFLIGFNIFRFSTRWHDTWLFWYTGFLFVHTYIWLFSGWKSGTTYSISWLMDSIGHFLFFFISTQLSLHTLVYFLANKSWWRMIGWYVIIFFVGMGIGAGFEVIEYYYDKLGMDWLPPAQEDNDDTMLDIIVNGVGVAFALVTRVIYDLRWPRKHPVEASEDDDDDRIIATAFQAIQVHFRIILDRVRRKRERHSDQTIARKWLQLLRKEMRFFFQELRRKE